MRAHFVTGAELAAPPRPDTSSPAGSRTGLAGAGSPAAAQVRVPCARHQPTLIAAARSQTTASSPCGTFSQAELTAELVTG